MIIQTLSRPLFRVRYSASAGSSTWLDSAGLLYSNGIEPAGTETTFFPVNAANKVHYVDLDALSNGDGSSASPFWSFNEVNAGTAPGYQGGDHIYGTGTGTPAKIATQGAMGYRITSESRLGSTSNPTVIRSWPGRSRLKIDGQLTNNMGIYADPSTNSSARGIVVINIEITGCIGTGTSNGSTGIQLGYGNNSAGIDRQEVISCWVHDNAGNDNTGNSSMGGIGLATVGGTGRALVIRNCLVHDNTHLVGGAGSLSDNTGGINCLTEATDTSSTWDIYDNIIHDEYYAIRHKHAGAVTTTIYQNYSYSNQNAFFQIRGLHNVIHTNLVKSTPDFLRCEPQNQTAIRDVTLYSNTLYNVNLLHEQLSDPFTFNDTFNCYQNIYYYSGRTADFASFGSNGSSGYYQAGVSMNNNVIYSSATTTFYTKNGTENSRTNFDTQFGAGVNVYTDPLFTNAASNDFTLQAASPALSVNGNRAGAF